MAGVLLTLLVLKTRQVDSLRTFYGALGVEFVEERHGNGPLHFAGRIGDIVIEVYPLPEDGSAADAATRLGFAVEKLIKAVEALQAVGAVVAKPQATEWGWRAVVRDPDGRVVELYQR